MTKWLMSIGKWLLAIVGIFGALKLRDKANIEKGKLEAANEKHEKNEKARKEAKKRFEDNNNSSRDDIIDGLSDD